MASTSDAWCVLDRQHRLLLWNDSVPALLGRQGLPLANETLSRFLAPSHAPDVHRAVDAVLARPGSHAVELSLELLPDGGQPVRVFAQVGALRGREDGLWMMQLRRQASPSSPDARLQAAVRQWKLTVKQRDVLQLVARGLSNKAVADQLGCAESTVELHMTAVFKKSGTKGRSMLLAQLFHLG